LKKSTATTNRLNPSWIQWKKCEKNQRRNNAYAHSHRPFM